LNTKTETNPPAVQNELDALTQSLIQSYEEVALLHRISDSMRITRQPQEFFQRIAHDLRLVLDVQQLWVFLEPQNQDDTDLIVAANDGSLELTESWVRQLWQRTSEKSATPLGALIDNQLEGSAQYGWPDEIENIVAVAIKRNDKVLGLIAAANKVESNQFDSVDIKMLASVATESAVYLENFNLYQDLQDLMMGSLRALTKSIDVKDPYTCGHSERVAITSRWLAQGLGLDENAIRDAYLGGLLHDVGKIGVSESILTKPGKLTDQEFDEIRKHPEIGTKILQDIKPLREVNRAVLTHHERLNGSGYPHHLRKDEIPMIGRIVGLADSFDAMINERVYRSAFSLPQVLKEINQCRNTHYDPKLVDLMTPKKVKNLLTHLNQIPNTNETLTNLYTPQTLN
jgi:putative nucleotidyltransferase with HDIG domain